MSGIPVKRSAQELFSSSSTWLNTISAADTANNHPRSVDTTLKSVALDPASVPASFPAQKPAPSEQPREPQSKRAKANINAFSTVVKTKLQSSTRTGQACDRCKVRKIRCDALPDGCSHCVYQKISCFVTDRITGRTERRGYLKELETQIEALQARLQDMETLLLAHGTQVFPHPLLDRETESGDVDPSAPCEGFTVHEQQPPQQPSPEDGWYQYRSLWLRKVAKASCENDNPGQMTVESPHQTWAMENNIMSSPRHANRGLSSATPPSRSTRQSSTPSLIHSLSYFPSTLKADNVGYIGASMDAAPLSSLSGTNLLIMGTIIDTGDFERPDYEEGAFNSGVLTPRYNKSVQALMQSMMNMNPILPGMGLPPREEAFRYTQWYFLMLEKFLPMLHQPTIWKMLTRIYDEPGYKPTASESVLVHMIYSTMLFHYGIRNSNSTVDKAKYNDLSNKHYHYALSHFYRLICERSIQACQAIALLAIHARNFPKPHATIILSNQALARAWSMNLNRRPDPAKFNKIEIEMRNRLWWVILLLNVTMQGYMGRPMPVTNRDYDVDFPEPVHDDMITEHGIDSSKNLKYPYWAGIAFFRSMPLFIDLYSHLYSAKRDPHVYAVAVAELESRLQSWKSSLPSELVVEPGPLSTFPPGSDPVTILYIQEVEVRFRFFLRHPNVAMTRDARFAADNVRICEGLSEKMLIIVTGLMELKSLDTTWSAMSMYGAFLFTTLAGHWQRRLTATSESIDRLRSTIDGWLAIIKEVAHLIGAGNHAVDQMRDIVNRTLEQIEADSRLTRYKLHSEDVHSASNPHPPLFDGKMPLKTDMTFLKSFPTSQSETRPPQAFNPIQYQNQQQQTLQDPSTVAVASAAQAMHNEVLNSSLYYANEADDQDDGHEEHEQHFAFPSSQVLLPPHPPPSAQDAEDDEYDWTEPTGSKSVRNAWREWTEAIIENPDRASLSKPPKPYIIDPSQPPSHTGADMSSNAQWPMLAFHDPNLHNIQG
ncbi:Transcriptional activator protein acu-15 [Ceratocystis lukuohia]|uniref:Transcriptional activator protein acu-15 n=1 Tax=Ceratocystis lukuohia TaxID=2019550 RepID=A0ABR4MMF8_9PEZI